MRQEDQHEAPYRAPQARVRKRWRGGRILLFSSLSLLVGLIAAIGFASWFVWDVNKSIPDVDNLADIQTERPTVVLAADGRQLTQFKNMQREWTPLKQISPWVLEALIATEDRRFYEHRGVDFERTASATWQTIKGDMQGGSTITQQLARNLFPEEIGRGRNITRKLKEMLTARKIERRHSKQEILEIYLNTVPFLYNVFGIEMAARTYYAKTAAELGPLESATLVGMLKGTHYYNPVVNPERARTRRNIVLSQLARSGHLDDAAYRQMRLQPLQLKFNRQQEPGYGPALHFTEYVRRWLTDWAEKNNVDLYADGLIVHTTLDPGLQELALQSVEKQTGVLQQIADVEWAEKSPRVLSHTPTAYAKKHAKVEPFSWFWKSRDDLQQAFIRESPQYRKAVQSGKSPEAALGKLSHDAAFMQSLREAKTRLEAGFVAMQPSTGEVKVWVGSRDFERDQFDHVAQALRQPGSTFKPIVYGAALERGFSPNRTYLDTHMNIGSAEGGNWTPTDMGAPSEVPMTMREGLILSRNTITAQVMQDVGLTDIVALAHAVGINRSKLDAVPSLALGTSPVTLLEMLSAYGTIARGGQALEPVVVKRITDRDGKVIAEFGKPGEQAMSVETATELIDMMRGVVNRGTGQEIKTRFNINADVAGKTGTTQYNTDGWFIMMHPDLVAGSWVGFNDARVTMRSNYWGQGGHNALLLVGDFYKTLLKQKRIDSKAQFPRRSRSEMLASTGPTSRWIARGGSAGGTEGAIMVQRAPDGGVTISGGVDTDLPSLSSSSLPSTSSATLATAGATMPSSGASGNGGSTAASDPVAAARAAARGAVDMSEALLER